MNRVLKKALSFLTAVFFTASAGASMVTASGAYSFKAEQKNKNNYEAAIGFINGAFFATKAEVIQNKTEQTLPEDTIPVSLDDWRVGYECYHNVSIYTIDRNIKYSGEYSFKIHNSEYNDTCLEKTFTVKPNTKYRFSAMVKFDGFETNPNDTYIGGANIGEAFTFSHSDYATENKWKKLEYIFDTDDRTEITLCLRNGMFSACCKGTAWFSDVKLEENQPDSNGNDNYKLISDDMYYPDGDVTEIQSSIISSNAADYDFISSKATYYGYISPNAADYGYISPNAADYDYISPNAADYGYISPNAADYGYISPNAADYGYISPNAADYDYISPNAADYDYISPNAADYGYISSDEAVIAGDETYLYFPSDSEFNVINSKGQRIKIENTIGFTRVYDICSDNYNAYAIQKKYYECNDGYVAVGNGKWYSVLFSDGSFLGGGEKYNNIYSRYGIICAELGGNTTYFNGKGEKLFTLKTGEYGEIIDADNENDLILFHDQKITNYTVVSKGGNVLKTSGDYTHFVYDEDENASFASDFVVEGYDDNNCWRYEHYNVRGEIIYTRIYNYRHFPEPKDGKLYDASGNEIDESTVYKQAEKKKYLLNAEIEGKAAEERVYTGGNSITVKKSNGKEIARYGVFTYYRTAGNYMYIFSEGLHVYNRATGELITDDNSSEYNSILEISDDGKTAVISIGTPDLDCEKAFYSVNAREVSKNYFKKIVPLGTLSSTPYIIAAGNDPSDHGLKYGILNSDGKITLQPSYDYHIFPNADISVFRNGTVFDVYDSKKGKLIVSNVRMASGSGRNYAVRALNNEDYRIITANKDGTKFGLMVIQR